jgi:hypothetical protein
VVVIKLIRFTSKENMTRTDTLSVIVTPTVGMEPRGSSAKIQAGLQPDGTIDIYMSDENADDFQGLKAVHLLSLVQEVCNLHLKFSESQRQEALTAFRRLKAVMKDATELLDEQIVNFNGDLDVSPG